MDAFSYKKLWFILLLAPILSYTQAPNIEKISIEAPELNTQKNIWILIPETTNDPGKKYPVIYMHDAQNLFFKELSYAGEWEVDETIDSLNLEYIIVGIEHGNEKRIDELTPYSHPEYKGGNGKLYSEIIVNTLKPEIERRYPALPDRENTIIAGSSLGGLISHYMLFTYPEVFSKAIIFSPSYWYSEKIFGLTENTEAPADSKIYMATGALEPGSAVTDLERMTELLRSRGFDTEQLYSEIRIDAKHNEAFWSREFPKAILWMTGQNPDQDR
ncbi:alpha/beta hydrolase [Robertkochia flava]|uniref:alpha/beta hydrolase n=1 Tax=Robertkochia flava TaxID=3447986 RepID=UPI001CCBF441|nr:alpha/beta hydrolase-fold protein [Robertkochia marina]